ncbi:MAG: EF-hand domain-containing protein [Verrucomicrobiales bacterium]|nr:EF-hand domain-containing protein [Verrucomicrobiales bacterium]
MKKTSKITITVAGLAALALPSISLAQGPPPGGGDRPEGGRRGGAGSMTRFIPALKAIDANEDGEFSAEEIKNATAALLTLDKNEDGKLDAAELRPNFAGRGGDQAGGRGGNTGNPEQTVSRLMAFDKNKDGKLTKDELSERMQGLLNRADTNKDGEATKEELLAMAKAGGTRGGGGERRRPHGGGERPQRPPSE